MLVKLYKQMRFYTFGEPGYHEVHVIALYCEKSEE